MKYFFYKLKFFFKHNVAFGIISERNLSIENFVVALFKSSTEYKDFLCLFNHLEGEIELYVILKGEVLLSTSLVPNISEEELIEFCNQLIITIIKVGGAHNLNEIISEQYIRIAA
jgi:hypothetical protein